MKIKSKSRYMNRNYALHLARSRANETNDRGDKIMVNFPSSEYIRKKKYNYSGGSNMTDYMKGLNPNEHYKHFKTPMSDLQERIYEIAKQRGLLERLSINKYAKNRASFDPRQGGALAGNIATIIRELIKKNPNQAIPAETPAWMRPYGSGLKGGRRRQQRPPYIERQDGEYQLATNKLGIQAWMPVSGITYLGETALTPQQWADSSFTTFGDLAWGGKPTNINGFNPINDFWYSNGL